MNVNKIVDYCCKNNIEVKAATDETQTSIVVFDDVAMVRTTQPELTYQSLSGMFRSLGGNKDLFREWDYESKDIPWFKTQIGWCSDKEKVFEKIKNKCILDVVNTYLTLNREFLNCRLFVTSEGINLYDEKFLKLIPLIMSTFDDMTTFHEGPLFIDGSNTEMLISPCYTDTNINEMINVDYFREGIV